MIWIDASHEREQYFYPAPQPALPGHLRLQFGRYKIISDHGRCYYITDEHGTVLFAEYSPHASVRRVERRGKRALQRAMQLSGTPDTSRQVLVDRDRYIAYLEEAAGIK